MRWIVTVTWLALTFGGVVESRGQAPSRAADGFPASTAEAEGVSPAALATLDRMVARFVEEDAIVGGELLVIKNGRTILETAHGFCDRESKRALKPGAVHCVRSMTKPVIAAAILMLVADGKLKLENRAAQYLPEFDTDELRDITVEQLLTHTSGLPLSLLLGRDFSKARSIREVAALASGKDLKSAPGTAFHYSDQGTDTLTAIIGVVTEAPPEAFVTKRILEPLGMQESTCILAPDHPLRSRACSKYVGQQGSWTRFWDPAAPSIFPCFLGSQGLYSTTRDYARFLDFWMQRGRAGKKRLLGRRLVRKALRAGAFPFEYGTGIPGVRSGYGFLMQVWHGEPDPARGGRRPLVAFGHSGSDGTYAWAFPEQKALVLYFTQSRGNPTGLEVERGLGELFLGAASEPNVAPPDLEPYLGYYWEGEGDLYRAIVRDGRGLALEILGKLVVPLVYMGDDRWRFKSRPGVVLAFERGPEGAVTGYRIGDHREFRFEPSGDLPRVDELCELVKKTHRLDRVAAEGPVRMKGSVRVPRFEIEGTFATSLARGGRFRIDSEAAEEKERLAWDGEQLRYENQRRPVSVLEGHAARLLRTENPFARFGDWRRWHDDLRVIQRLEEDGREVILVRTGGTEGPARTLYVDPAQGRVLREDGFTWADPLGRIGQRVTYGDFREVGGSLLPFRTRVVYANPMAGKVVADFRVETVESKVALADGWFRLEP